MRSKTSFFNAALWRKTICRFWPLWVIYLAVWFFVLLLPLGSSLRWWIADGYSAAIEAKYYILSAGLYGGIFISLFGGLAIAMAMFGYLYNGRHAGMMAALPIRREGQFLSQYLAGLFMLLVMDLVIALLTLGISGFYGVFQPTAVLQWLGQVALLNLFFYSFAVMVAQLTGNIIILPLVYGVFNVVVPAFELLFRGLISTFVYGMSRAIGTGSEGLHWCSPVLKLLSNCAAERDYHYIYDSLGYVSRQNLVGTHLEGWFYLVVYGLAGLAFAGLAFCLFRRRRMETAGDVVAWQRLKPVFLVCMAIGSGLCIGALFLSITQYRSLGPVLAFVALGCFVGWFAGAMLVKKRFRVFTGRNFMGFAVVAVCMVGLLLAWEFDAFGYERRIPAPAEVDQVTVLMNGEHMSLEEAESLELVQQFHQTCLEERALGERSDWDGYYEGRYLDVSLEYQLKDGRRLVRSYNFPDLDEDAVQSETRLGGRAMAVANCSEARVERKEISGAVAENTVSYAAVEYWDPLKGEYLNLELTAAEGAELYETCLKPETENGALTRVWLFEGEEFEKTACTVMVYLELRHPRAAESGDGPQFRYESINYNVTVDAEVTCAWLEAKGVNIATVEERNRYYQQLEKEGAVDSALREELGIPAGAELPTSDSALVYAD